MSGKKHIKQQIVSDLQAIDPQKVILFGSLAKAIDDLRWTKANLREKIYYGACFTAQQAVEKALKGHLLYKQGRFSTRFMMW